jgi:hypothetical protein
MTARLSKAALMAATPALSQARWGHADQPMPKSYSDRGWSEWSGDAYAAAPLYAYPSYGYRSYGYQPYPRYGVEAYGSFGFAPSYGYDRSFDRGYDAPNRFGHN